MLSVASVPAPENTISLNNAMSHSETLPPDHEIFDRVMEIRSHWTLEERIQRREEGDRRFADLMSLLSDVAA